MTEARPSERKQIPALRTCSNQVSNDGSYLHHLHRREHQHLLEMRLPMTIRRAATMLSPASASTMMVPRSAIAFPGQIDALPVASSSRSNLLPRLYSTGAEASPRSSIPLEGENREQEIRVKLEEALKPTRLAIQDTSGQPSGWRSQ